MPEFTKDQKIFITKEFAMFSTPQEIVDLVKENFDIECERTHVAFYNVDRNPKPPLWLKEIFDATRKNFLEDVSTIPIANKAYRMRELDRIYGNQKRQPAKLQNPVEMRATLKQAAEEEGGAFTNQRVLTGKNDGPIQTQSVVTYDLSKLTTEELMMLKTMQDKLQTDAA